MAVLVVINTQIALYVGTGPNLTILLSRLQYPYHADSITEKLAETRRNNFSDFKRALVSQQTEYLS